MDLKSNVQAWATAVSKHSSNGREIIFRYVQHLSPAFDVASQPDRIILVWKYESESGQPLPEDHQRMNRLEDLLEPLEDKGHFATLTVVSTGENLREWIYYAKSGDDFIAQMNTVLSGEPVFPIEIHMTSDPTWANYVTFRTGVRETTN